MGAGASQRLVEALLAGDSLFSPIAASDFDDVPALFFSSAVWLACWLAAGAFRGVFDDVYDAPAWSLCG